MSGTNYLITNGLGNFASGTAPADPTITATDQNDGTADVVISGSTSGSTNTVYTATWDGTTGALGTWTSGGNRSGDGTVSVSLGNGLYMVYVDSVVSGQSGTSNPVYLAMHDGTLSVLERITDAVESRIKSLSLSKVGSDPVRNIPNANVLNIKVTRKEGINYPAIIITPPGKIIMPPKAGTNKRDDVYYPILVQIADKDNREYKTNHSSYYLWQEKIAKAFRNQLLTGVDEVFLGHCEYVDVVNERVWNVDRKFICGVLLYFSAWEQRGV